MTSTNERSRYGFPLPTITNTSHRIHFEASARWKTVKGYTENSANLGFGSSNDRPLLTTIKFIGLIDNSGAPTALWDRMRANMGEALATGLRQGYKGLFEFYPDANNKSDAELKTYFSANSSVGSAAVTRMVGTFKAMANLADFESEPKKTKTEPDAKPPRNLERKNSEDRSIQHSDVAVNINIQLQLPADATGETYEKFFSAMQKHLISLK